MRCPACGRSLYSEPFCLNCMDQEPPAGTPIDETHIDAILSAAGYNLIDLDAHAERNTQPKPPTRRTARKPAPQRG